METNGAKPTVPTVIIQLLPGALAGQPSRVEVRTENSPGWPLVVQLLIKALDAAVPKAYEQIAEQKPRIIPPGGGLPTGFLGMS